MQQDCCWNQACQRIEIDETVAMMLLYAESLSNYCSAQPKKQSDCQSNFCLAQSNSCSTQSKNQSKNESKNTIQFFWAGNHFLDELKNQSNFPNPIFYEAILFVLEFLDWKATHGLPPNKNWTRFWICHFKKLDWFLDLLKTRSDLILDWFLDVPTKKLDGFLDQFLD